MTPKKTDEAPAEQPAAPKADENIYTIKMLKPRVLYSRKTAVGDIEQVFAKDARRLVGQDKAAEYHPPLADQKKAIAAELAKATA